MCHLIKSYNMQSWEDLLYHYNTKSTDAQGKLKPRSVITREEGGLGFLIIPRAQPEGWLKTLIHPTPEWLQIEVLISRGHGALRD